MHEDFDDSIPNLAINLGRIFGHPLRVRIVATLMHSDASASRLAAAFDEPVGTVAYHLCRVLYDRYELVEIVAQHQRRGATETVYRLRDTTAVRFLALAIAALQERNRGPESNGRFDWRAVAVDANGEREVEATMKEFSASVEEIQRRSLDSDSIKTHSVILSAAAISFTPVHPFEDGGWQPS